jgi:hypothetical protein
VSKGTIAAVIAVLTALVLALAGCGGGDDTTSLTKAQYVKQANAICKKGEEERSALLQSATENVNREFNDAEKEKVVMTVFVPPYRQTIKKLEELPSPEGEEEKVEAITKAMDVAAKKVEADPLKGLEDISQFEEANKLASDYGITNCVV